MLTLTLGAITATSVTLNTLTRTAGYDRVDVQVSTRPDFLFVLAPIYPYVGAAAAVLSALNQGTLYFIRARERVEATGAVLPWTAALTAYTPVAVAQVTAPLSIMVRPAIIVPPEPAVWTSANAEVARPADNLSSDAPAEQCWLSGSAAPALDFDTGGQPIDTVALLGSNAAAATTWQVRSYPTAADRTAGTNVAYNSGAITFHASAGLPGRPAYHGMHRMPVPRAERFWRVTFGGTLPPTNLLAFTYGVVGLARTAKNIAADKVEAALDYGSVERLRDGTPDRRAGFRGRRVEFEIAVMTEAQWETQFSDLRHRIALSDPVFVLPNTRDGAFLHDRMLYGPMASLRTMQPYSPRFSEQFAIESLI